MFHLFDKIYITTDLVIDLNVDRVVISSTHGNQMLELLDKATYGELIAYGLSLDAVLEDTSFPALLQTLKNYSQASNRKIVIYADDLNFSKFISIWFKSIFVNISVDNAWTLLSLYIEKENFLMSSKEVSMSSYAELFPLMTYEEFSSNFSSATGYDLENISAGLSVEIFLATYLANGSYKTELKTSIKHLLTRALSDIATDIKYCYIKNCKKSSFPTIAKDHDFFTNSTVYPVVQLGQVSTYINLANLATSLDSDIAKFKNISTELFLNWDLFTPQSHMFTMLEFIDFIRQSDLSDSDLETLTDYEKNSPGTCRIFSSADELSVNIYFFDYVLNASAEDLAGYVIK